MQLSCNFSFLTCFFFCLITLFDFIEIGAFFGGAEEAKLETRTHTYSTGAVYEGEWIGDKRHGKGKMTWKDGSFYEGEWKENEANGEGTMHYSTGDSFKGIWVRNKANGYGEWWTSDGSVYASEWVNDF